VPVTAKLSKHFYDVLGEDVANELVDWFSAVDLTYRTELREVNELNYARFDAKLEQRLAELRAELRQEMAALKSELRQDMSSLWQAVHGQTSALREADAGIRGELRAEIHAVRASLLRWMFGFWVTSALTLGGLIAAVLARAR
jgi:hypothetical protein